MSRNWNQKDSRRHSAEQRHIKRLTMSRNPQLPSIPIKTSLHSSDMFSQQSKFKNLCLAYNIEPKSVPYKCKIQSHKKLITSPHLRRQRRLNSYKSQKTLQLPMLFSKTLNIKSISSPAQPSKQMRHYKTVPNLPTLNLKTMANHSNNTEKCGVNPPILLQFDLAPNPDPNPIESDPKTNYQISNNGVFKQDLFEISKNGLTIKNENPNLSRFMPLCSADHITIRVLGRGSSGVVYKAWDYTRCHFVALKYISVFEYDKRIQLINELTTLTLIDKQSMSQSLSPSIIDFYGAYFEEGKVVLSLEYCEFGSLDTIIDNIATNKSSHNTLFNELLLSQLSVSICYAIKDLHSHNLIHRDIKPSNVLLRSDGSVKICDFGICTKVDSDIPFCDEMIGTTIYMSPERILAQQYSFAADIWSFGLILITIALGKFPFETNAGNWTDDFITNTKPLSYLSDDNLCINVSNVFKDFVSKCMNIDPKLRLTAEQLLSHPFIKNMDKQSLNKSQLWKEYLFKVSQQRNESESKKNTIQIKLSDEIDTITTHLKGKPNRENNLKALSNILPSHPLLSNFIQCK